MRCVCEGHLLGDRIQAAGTFFTRFRGLMGKKTIAHGEGLLLIKCNAIHMCFMRFPLDVVYLSASWDVLSVQAKLSPWHLGARVRGACHVLELPAGTVPLNLRGKKLEIHC